MWQRFRWAQEKPHEWWLAAARLAACSGVVFLTEAVHADQVGGAGGAGR